VTDPATPAEIGFYTTLGYGLNLAVTGSLAFVAGGFSGLRILDLHDPSQPREIGWHPVPEDCVDVAVVGNTAYVATRYGGLLILDVGDPTGPVPLAFTPCQAVPGVWRCWAA